MSYSSNCTTTNSCEMEIEEEIGSFLSMFEGLQSLGEGAFAKVFMGTHSLDGQKFAIKQALTKSYNEELQNEARILGSLDHPFINKLYYFNDQKYTNQLSCMVVDLEENGDLLENIMRFGRFHETIVRRIAVQMLDALEYLHMKGIAHNDIKCENFAFNKEFDIKLIDFGLATQSRYISSQILGTIGYQAPEIVRRQFPYDAFKADVFALGVVFFTMYIGKFPFKEANALISNYKLFILNNEKFWEKHEKSHRNLKISQGFKELINGMLEVNSFERFDFQRIKRNKWINEQFATREEVRCHCSKERK